MRKAVWAALTAIFGVDEVLVLIGLVLVSTGCWWVWKPAALLVPGLTILWMFLPTRAAFVEPLPMKPGKRKRAAL